MRLKFKFRNVILLAMCLIFSNLSYAHEIGLQLYSLRNQMKEDMPKAFKQVHDWGFHVVEGVNMLFDTPIEEYKALLEKNDLELVSIGTNFNELRDNPMSVVYKAKFFGAKYATLYWIPHGENRAFNIDDAKSGIKVLNEAGAVLKRNGITLQYHAHGYEFYPHGDELIIDYMIKNTQHAEFQMDVYWVRQTGMDPLVLLRKYPGRFTSLHLKDRRHGSPDSLNGLADPETVVVLGDGDVGIKPLFKEAKKQGIRYFFIEDESSRVLIQVPKSIEYMKSIDK